MSEGNEEMGQQEHEGVGESLLNQFTTIFRFSNTLQTLNPTKHPPVRKAGEVYLSILLSKTKGREVTLKK
jgi:hypothetical protein